MTTKNSQKTKPELTEKQQLCLQCLACCKSLLFKVSAARESLEFYRARGIRILHPSNLTGNFFYVEVPHVCKHLTSKGCAVYDNRPESCRVYDGRTNVLTKDICLWSRLDKDKGGV